MNDTVKCPRCEAGSEPGFFEDSDGCLVRCPDCEGSGEVTREFLDAKARSESRDGRPDLNLLVDGGNMSTANIDYNSLTQDDLYYLVGQAAVWYFKAGGDRGALDDLLDDAEDEADIGEAE